MRFLPKNPETGWTPFAWLIWLFPFLFYPAFGRVSMLEWFATIGAIAVFLTLYFRAFWLPGRRRLPLVLGILLIGVLFLPFNAGASTFFIYAGCFLGDALPRKEAWRWVIAFTLLLLAEALLVDAGWSGVIPGLVFTPLIGGINIHFGEVSRRNARLRLAQEEVERLAKLDERERIARDLHDLLGHSLSVITLKSQLAARLAAEQPERAAEEMREVERISRETTNEVRRAVQGYRSQKLGSELAKARMALEAAGIELHVESGPFDLSSEEESAVALALREAITNVIRHAKARRCAVRLDSTGGRFVLEIEDDGRGVRRPPGSGLLGMHERIDQVGGTVEIESERRRGTIVRIVLASRRRRPGDDEAAAPSNEALAESG